MFRAVQEGLVPHVTPKSQLLGGGKRSGGVGFPKQGLQIDPYVFRAFFLGGEGVSLGVVSGGEMEEKLRGGAM